MTTSFEPRPAPRVAPWLVYIGGWALLLLVYAALFSAGGAPFPMAVRGATAAVLPNAVLGWISLRLGRATSPSPGRLRQAIRLCLGALAVAAAGTAGWLGIIALELTLTPEAGKWPAGAIVAWQFVVNSLLHGTLAGIGYAGRAAEELREAQERAARAEVLRARAELQLLRSQLQPHFVMNTLHALLGLVRRDPARAETALEKLGDLLKFGQWVHQSGADFVPFSREWDFAKSYLELERIRFGERLGVALEADEAALSVAVPPFALQPLVENAILHGVAPRASGGRIEVSARRLDGWLSVTVRDDGPGTSPDAIRASPRMGLRLLQERLAALYSGRARLSYESPEDGGFRVRLEVPDDRAPEAG
jgi:signal transduction histidine kinase